LNKLLPGKGLRSLLPGVFTSWSVQNIPPSRALALQPLLLQICCSFTFLLKVLAASYPDNYLVFCSLAKAVNQKNKLLDIATSTRIRRK
jgi:hypothetical protein